MSEQKPDMSNVVVGTMVRHRNGDVADVTHVLEGSVLPIRTGLGFWHKDNGVCAGIEDQYRQYDIIKIISHPPANKEANDTVAVEKVPCDEKASLRDLFAMSALTGLISAGAGLDDAARWSYTTADAMLEARSK